MDKPLFSDAARAAAFAESLETISLGKPLHYFQTTRSTNDLALEAARSGAAHGTVFIADQQTGGRGRSGRSWHSAPNRGLLLSVIVRPREIAPADLGWIPLLAGLSVARAVQSCCGLAATIKWPNDVVIPADHAPGWRKLGGILCESSLTPGAPEQSFAVIGIGLNVNHTLEDFPPQPKAPPTSVLLETKKHGDRRAILAELLRELEDTLLVLEQGGGESVRSRVLEALQSWWTVNALLTINPQPGDISNERLEGVFSGLDEYGRLRLHVLPGSGERTFADAEILGMRKL
ncbi:MAG TPA: biotin--[acetyl-CoA-carboxylase] ligase [Planctomycetota bacterium]|nr:biotin--[acetyl-CoA-carboxylase] ligase [Planctomycetota bacterium]